jgi:hypothetical protein
MEASGDPWAAGRPYIVGTQRCNRWRDLVVYLAQFTAIQRSGALNRSIANDSLQPNGYFAIMANSVWESAFVSLHAGFWPTCSCYALL